MPETKATQRECPFCEKVTDSRGLYAHVMNSHDEAHGEPGSVPEGFEPRQAPIVTEESEVIQTDLDEEFPNRLLMCHHCGTMAKGRRGLSIHLSKSAGDELHPPGASIEQGNYTTIPADEDWNPVVDQHELSELHTEITSDIHMHELYQNNSESERELEERIDQAVIPTNESKVEQVASLIEQVPELYDRPKIIKEEINCSTTTFYEGRKLFDNSSNHETISVIENLEEHDSDPEPEPEPQSVNGSIVVDGERYVPLKEYQDMVKKVNRKAQELQEIGNRGAQVIHRNS